MSVQLSSLRVSLEMDGSNYVQGAAAVARANEQMAASGTLAGAQLAQQDVAAGNAGAALTRLSRANVDGYASSSQFYRGVASLQTQMEAGKVTADRAAVTYTGLVNRFGAVADATAIAGKGGAAFAAVVDSVNQKVVLQADALGKARAAVSPMTAALGGLQMQMVAMAAGAGPVAVFLSALGPWGIAAAVGVGLVSAAFEEAQRTAHLLAAEAVSLEKFSETTGLSTDTLQALTQAAAKHGVSADEATNSIVRFTSSWALAREGGGAFLTQLQKINPGLADQIQRTKDSGAAFEILTKAIQQANAAGDIAQRNLLLRAAGGRGGVTSLTGVAAAVGDAGGLGNLTQDAIDAGLAIDGKLLGEIRILKAELDETTKHADLLFGTIGAKPILEAQLAWQKMRVSIAETTASLAKAEESKPFWQWYFDKLGQAANEAAGLAFSTEELARRMEGLNQPAVNQRPAYPPQLNMAGLESPPQPKDLKAQLADLKELNSLRGAGATIAQKLTERELELTAAIEAKDTPEVRAAAAIGKSIAQYEAYSKQITLTNSALGVAATVAETVAQKTADLNMKIAAGADLSGPQYINAKRLIQAQADGTYALQGNINAINVQAQSFNMGAGAAETFRIVQTKVNENLNAGKNALDGLSPEFYKLANAAGAGAQALEKVKIDSSINFGRQTAFLTSEDVQIAQQLAKYYNNDIPAALASSQAAAIRLNNAFQDFSNTSRDTLKGFATDMRTSLQSGATAWDSFQKAGVNALNKISDKLMSMAIDSLWSKAFGGASGGLLSLLFGGFANPTNAGVGTGVSDGGFNYIDAAVKRNGGMVGSGGEHQWVPAAYFDNAPRMVTGGMITDGGVPIIAHPGERVLNRQQTAAYNSGGSSVTIHLGDTHIDASGADPAIVARMQTALLQDQKQRYAQVVKIIQDASNRGMRLHP